MKNTRKCLNKLLYKVTMIEDKHVQYMHTGPLTNNCLTSGKEYSYGSRKESVPLCQEKEHFVMQDTENCDN